MRVGIDVFTIRELNLNPFQQADYIESHGFEGLQYGGVRSLSEKLDHGELKALRQYCDEKGLYSEVSVSCVNPIMSKLSPDELLESLKEEIAAAAATGWHELHSVICHDTPQRYSHAIPWSRHIEESIKFINRLRPTLEKYDCRLNLEDHSDSTHDLLRVIEGTGTHLVGICLDTANTLCNAEDPVMAAKRVAPYIHLTHTKDAIICFDDKGILRQGKCPGQGCVDFEKILPILGEYEPNLPLSIEDHKWLFTADIFDPAWIAHNPALTPEELGQFVKLAWSVQKKLYAGEIPPVDEYEKTPYLEEMEERLAYGRDYLKGLLDRLGLHH